MPTYGNIGGASKEIKPWYTNIIGAQNTISNIYTNINGTSKEIYTKQLSHWWKQYPVTSWSQSNSITFYNMSSDKVNGQDHYGYKQYGLSQSGTFNLSGGFNVSYTSEDSGYNGSTISTANESFYNYYCTDSGIVTQQAIVFVTSYSYGVFSSGGYEEFMSGTVTYATPVSRSSQYTLVKDLVKKYPDNGYHYEQSWVDSDFNGAKYAYIYDGYYYEYLGYYA